ncbi:MAG TPA: Rrf2 family transcriptional regulator [Elusimicrobiota bacterium]|jgi:Rrf2 family protein|nr:Rrf2 family transcriptional regulator [Elusimicrobiota bacterium]
MKIASSVEYAARLMVRLAGQPADSTLSAEILAEKENIPRDFVDQILLRLRRAGLVTARRGAHGGYALARRPEEISVGQVVQAVDQALFESVCDRYAEGEHMCAHTSGCGIRPMWRRLNAMIEDFLGKVTLAQLCAEEPRVDDRVAALFSIGSEPGR